MARKTIELALFTLLLHYSTAEEFPLPFDPSSGARVALAEHNRARRNVYPSARYMPDMRWSASTTRKAEKFVRRLTSKCGDLRRTPVFINSECGENINAVTSSRGASGTWKEAIGRWMEEKNRFDYGCLPHPTNPGHTVMHYLQIIWADATNLGCAAHACRQSDGKVRTFYLCLYCPGGYYRNKHPYEPKRGKPKCNRGSRKGVDRAEVQPEGEPGETWLPPPEAAEAAAEEPGHNKTTTIDQPTTTMKDTKTTTKATSGQAPLLTSSLAFLAAVMLPLVF